MCIIYMCMYLHVCVACVCMCVHVCVYVYIRILYCMCGCIFVCLCFLPTQVCLIPESAHGTNAASAQMAGLNVVYLPTDKNGMVSIDQFKEEVRT